MDYKTIKKEELDAWEPWCKDYLWDILTGRFDLNNAREDILSFRGSKYYKGIETAHKESNNA